MLTFLLFRRRHFKNSPFRLVEHQQSLSHAANIKPRMCSSREEIKTKKILQLGVRKASTRLTPQHQASFYDKEIDKFQSAAGVHMLARPKRSSER